MELAFCNAFSMGLSGMIANTYKLTDGEVNRDEDGDKQEEDEVFDVNLDVTLDPLPLAEKNGDITSPTEINKAAHSHAKKEIRLQHAATQSAAALPKRERTLAAFQSEHSPPLDATVGPDRKHVPGSGTLQVYGRGSPKSSSYLSQFDGTLKTTKQRCRRSRRKSSESHPNGDVNHGGPRGGHGAFGQLVRGREVSDDYYSPGGHQL